MSLVRGLTSQSGISLPRFDEKRHPKWVHDITVYIHSLTALGGQIIDGEIDDPSPSDEGDSLRDMTAQSISQYTITDATCLLDDDDTHDYDSPAGDALLQMSPVRASPDSGISPAPFAASDASTVRARSNMFSRMRSAVFSTPTATAGGGAASDGTQRDSEVSFAQEQSGKPGDTPLSVPTGGGERASAADTKTATEGKQDDPPSDGLPSREELMGMLRETHRALTKSRSRHRSEFSKAKAWREKVDLLVKSRIQPDVWEELDVRLRVCAYNKANLMVYNVMVTSLTYRNITLIAHVKRGDGKAAYLRVAHLRVEKALGATTHFMRKIMQLDFVKCHPSREQCTIRTYVHKLTELNKQYIHARGKGCKGVPVDILKGRVLDLPKSYQAIVNIIEEDDVRRVENGDEPYDIPAIVARIEAWELRQKRFSRTNVSGGDAGKRYSGRRYSARAAAKIAGQRRRTPYRAPPRKGRAYAANGQTPGKSAKTPGGYKPYLGTCEECGQKGHSAKFCPKLGRPSFAEHMANKKRGHAKAASGRGRGRGRGAGGRGRGNKSGIRKFAKKPSKPARDLGFHVEEVAGESTVASDISQGAKARYQVRMDAQGRAHHVLRKDFGDMLLDSGASNHYITSEKGLERARPTRRVIRGAGEELLSGSLVGDKGALLDAVVVKGLNASLCSVGQLTDHFGVGILLTSKGAFVIPREERHHLNLTEERKIAERGDTGLYHTHSEWVTKAVWGTQGRRGAKPYGAFAHMTPPEESATQARAFKRGNGTARSHAERLKAFKDHCHKHPQRKAKHREDRAAAWAKRRRDRPGSAPPHKFRPKPKPQKKQNKKKKGGQSRNGIPIEQSRSMNRARAAADICHHCGGRHIDPPWKCRKRPRSAAKKRRPRQNTRKVRIYQDRAHMMREVGLERLKQGNSFCELLEQGHVQDSWEDTEDALIADAGENNISEYESCASESEPEQEHAVQPTFLDLFCGIGGATTAGIQVGWRCLGSVDHCSSLKPYWRANFEHPLIVADLLDEREQYELVRAFQDKVDAVLLSPPCQPFSRAGLKMIDDPRAKLVTAGVCVAIALKPKLIVIENVKGMTTSKTSPVWKELCEPALVQQGYKVSIVRSNAARCGVPHSRERVWIVCTTYERSGKLEAHMKYLEKEGRHMPLSDWYPDLKLVRTVPCHGGPAVFDATKSPHPTFRTNSVMDLDYDQYVQHHRDAGDVKDAVSLSLQQKLELTGMPENFAWPHISVYCDKPCCSARRPRLPMVCTNVGNIVIPAQEVETLRFCELEAHATGGSEGALQEKDPMEDRALYYRDKPIADAIKRLHVRLGHASRRKMLYAVKQGLLGKDSVITVDDILNMTKEEDWCVICAKCNSTHGPHKRKLKERERTTKINDVVHTDTMHRVVKSLSGAVYIQVFVDEATRTVHVEYLKRKTRSEFIAMLKKAEAAMQVKHRHSKEALENPSLEAGRPVRTYFADHAGEFKAEETQEHLAEALIGAIMPAPGAKQSNGVAERMNRTLLDMTRRMLAHHDMPIYMWELAMSYAVIVHNILPNNANPGGKSPHQMYYGDEGEHVFDRLKAFGSVAWVNVEKRERKDESKLAPTAHAFVFVGLPTCCRRSVLVLNPRTGKVVQRYAKSVSVQEDASGAGLLKQLPQHKSRDKHKLYRPEPEDLPTEEAQEEPDTWNQTYEARDDETLRDIATRHGIDPSELQSHNSGLPGCDRRSGLTHLDAALRGGTGLWFPDAVTLIEPEVAQKSSEESEESEDSEGGNAPPVKTITRSRYPTRSRTKLIASAATRHQDDEPSDGESPDNERVWIQATVEEWARPRTGPNHGFVSTLSGKRVYVHHSTVRRCLSRESLEPGEKLEVQIGTDPLKTSRAAVNLMRKPWSKPETRPGGRLPRMRNSEYNRLRREELATATSDVMKRVYHLTQHSEPVSGETSLTNEEALFREGASSAMLQEMITGPARMAQLLSSGPPGDPNDPQSMQSKARRMVKRCEALYEGAYLLELVPQLEKAYLVRGLEGVLARDVIAPKNYRDALRDDFAEFWMRAVATEVANLEDRRVFSWAWLPPNRKAIDTTWAFRTKSRSDGMIDKLKARVCARGFRQIEGKDFIETTSPVTVFAAWRATMADAARPHWWVDLIDIKSAFLMADLQEEVYLKPFEGVTPPKPGMHMLLHKALYGLRQSSRAWHLVLKEKFLQMGFSQAVTDPSLFIYNGKKGEKLRVCVHVDDCCCSFNSQELYAAFRYALEEHFEISVSDNKNVYLGVLINRHKDSSISLSQQPYIIETLARYGMSDCKGANMPYLSGVKLSEDQRPKTDEEKKEMMNVPYKSLIGSLLYIANATRPDICHAVHACARHGSNPGKIHYKAALQILRYLKQTMDRVIIYGRKYKDLLDVPIHGYVDGSWADGDDRRSQTGYVFLSAGGPICWRSIRQKCISLSSTESEVVAASEAAKEAVWLRRLFLEDLGYDPADLSKPGIGPVSEQEARGGHPMILMEDNQGAIAISKNDVMRRATKHIHLRYLWCREAVKDSLIKLVKVGTESNLADIFTKPTRKATFVRLRDRLVHPYEKPVNETSYQCSKHSTSLLVPRPDANHKGSNDAASLDASAHSRESTTSTTVWDDPQTQIVAPGPPYNETIVWDDSHTEIVPLEPESPAAAASMASRQERSSTVQRPSDKLCRLPTCMCGHECSCGQDSWTSSRATPAVVGQRVVVTEENRCDVDASISHIPTPEYVRQGSEQMAKIETAIQKLWRRVRLMNTTLKWHRDMNLADGNRVELIYRVKQLERQLRQSRKSHEKAIKVLYDAGMAYDSDEWSSDDSEEDFKKQMLAANEAGNPSSGATTDNEANSTANGLPNPHPSKKARTGGQ